MQILQETGHWQIVCCNKPAHITEIADDDSNTIFPGEISSQMQNNKP